MELSYASATAADIQSVIALCKTLIDAYEDLPSFEYTKVLEWVEQKVRNNIEKYTVVILDGVKVGYYCLESRGDKWELDDFYILPAYRGRGIGTAVLGKVCNHIDGSIFLYVFRKNTKAVSLYKRFGFETVRPVSDTRQIMERPG